MINLSLGVMDAEKLLALLAIFLLWNRQAMPVMFMHAISVLLFSLLNTTGAYYFCVMSLAFALASTANIIICKDIRYLFFAISCLNLYAAFDFYISDYQTLFYVCYPSIVRVLDALLIAVLLYRGGLRFAGLGTAYYNFYMSVHRRISRASNMEDAL